MLTTTYHDMAVFIHDHPDVQACRDFRDAMDEEDTLSDNIEYFFSEAAPATLLELADRGLTIDRDAKTVTVSNREAIANAHELIAQITSDYEGETNHGWWEILGLGGDDDVDYNGGYLLTNLEVLEAMMEAQS